MPTLTSIHQPGTRVIVTQQMPQIDTVWSQTIEGTIVKAHRSSTGSWFAHGKDDKLWLDRLELRRDDGEIVVLNLDQYSVVERADDEASDTAAAPGDEAA